jgi:translation initiation factor 3 subunit E
LNRPLEALARVACAAPRRVDMAESAPVSTDLVPHLANYLDTHLMFPLLQFLEHRADGEDAPKGIVYLKKDVQRACVQLLESTNMVDYAIEVLADIDGKEPDEAEEHAPPQMIEKRNAVLDELDAQEERLKPLEELFQDAETIAELQQTGNFTAEHFERSFGIAPETLDAYFKFAKFQYECGEYGKAYEMLSNYLTLTQSGTSTAMGFNAVWGKFACQILLKNWDNALVEMNNVKAAIEERASAPLEQLQQRSWLLHWSLFVFFNHKAGLDNIIDLFFQEKYLQAIQTNCPWLLRYLTAAFIINKKRRNVLKDLVRVIQQEEYTYADPITQFIECLYVHFDFERAQQKLRECEVALQSDYFLAHQSERVMEDGRRFIFETYSRIHQKIDIPTLADKLGMELEGAERWIVDLIRGALLDAKIDSAESLVVMANAFPSVYQQVIDKTADLSDRSAMLVSNLDKLMADRRAEAAPKPSYT